VTPRFARGTGELELATSMEDRLLSDLSRGLVQIASVFVGCGQTQILLVSLLTKILHLLEINENINICGLGKQMSFISCFLTCQMHITEQAVRSHTCKAAQ